MFPVISSEINASVNPESIWSSVSEVTITPLKSSMLSISDTLAPKWLTLAAYPGRGLATVSSVNGLVAPTTANLSFLASDSYGLVPKKFCTLPVNVPRSSCPNVTLRCIWAASSSCLFTSSANCSNALKISCLAICSLISLSSPSFKSAISLTRSSAFLFNAGIFNSAEKSFMSDSSSNTCAVSPCLLSI